MKHWAECAVASNKGDTHMKTLYIGIDIDDQAFHGTGVCLDDRTELSFKCKPTDGALLNTLKPLMKKYHIKVCYEASYTGFKVHRFLANKNISSAVIAPSSLPRAPHDRIKNDRIDSKKLAYAYAKDLLTSVYIPDELTEEIRCLIRSRHYIVRKSASLKRHILSACRIKGWNYKHSEGSNKNYWTLTHLKWINEKLQTHPKAWGVVNLKNLLAIYKRGCEDIELYDQQLEEVARMERFRQPIEALQCFRGVSLLSALSLVVEIGDIRRFKGPRQLASYSGFDISEYSSGGQQRQGGITKQGNKYIRTLAIEACQCAARPVTISKRLKAQHKKMPDKFVEIAMKSMKRLRKRSLHLQTRHKPINKIKVACARELLGSIWAMLCVASG